jgi:hypothetical protein
MWDRTRDNVIEIGQLLSEELLQGLDTILLDGNFHARDFGHVIEVQLDLHRLRPVLLHPAIDRLQVDTMAVELAIEHHIIRQQAGELCIDVREELLGPRPRAR